MGSKSQVLVSFDTTGSMYPCLTQVRREVEATVKQLFQDIPDLEIGVITHGDYCDGPNWLSRLDFTSNQAAVCAFVRTSPATSGGDSPEAYESVLAEAQKFRWQAGAYKAMVLIGDAQPHEPSYPMNKMKYNWRNEATKLQDKGVHIYAVQCLNHASSTSFYEKLAELGQGYKLDLNQFAIITDLLKAICYKQVNKLDQFEAHLTERSSKTGKVIDISLLQNLDVLHGRKKRAVRKSALSAYAVDPARFQILDVDNDTPIKDFVEDNGLTFKTGRGFYEFTKPVEVQEYKEVVIQDKSTGEMFSGDKAREILGIPVGVRSKVKPTYLSKYRGFIQSTSNNRKLLGGTKFLYEVPEFSR